MDLEIWDIEIGGNTFEIDAAAPFVIPSQEFTEINVTFRSNETGVFTGYLMFTSNDRDNPDAIITLDATCIEPPDIEVSEALIELTLDSGILHEHPVTLENVGNSVLEFEFFVDDQITWLSVEPLTGSIPQQEELEILFNFDTSGLDENTYTTEVTLISNDPDENEIIIPVILTVNATANDPNIPSVTKLNSVFPNPFNPVTSFSYSLAEQTHVKLDIYNIKGQLISTLTNSDQKAGKYSINWQADYTASGVYFYHFSAGDTNQTGKMILLK